MDDVRDAVQRIGKSIDIEWRTPEGLSRVYANNLIIQHTPSEFILSFYMVEPPLLTGTQEERMEQLQRIDTVPADCVAKIVVVPDRLRLVRMLTGNLDVFRTERLFTDAVLDALRAKEYLTSST